MITTKTYNFHGRKEYIDKEVLDTAPTGLTGKVEFFKLDRYVSDDELDKEYESRGLTPATIQDLCEYDQNRLDDMKFVGTHWKDYDGNWCCAMFYRWYVRRKVNVYRSGSDWHDDWWFSGVRKSSTSDSKSSLSLELRVKALEDTLRKIKELL